MKCNEPKVYKVYTTRNEGAFGFCEGADPTDIELEHEPVCLKSDVDAAIAELKARIQLDDDEMAGFLQLEEECGGGDLRNYIAELKQKLSEKDAEIESLKASHYADSVDAGMRERRLQRALWLARVQRAIDKQKYYSECKSDGWVHRVNVWLEVERKCLKKAEEYR